MPVKVTVQLDADTQKLTDSIQKGMAKGFGGGAMNGILADPTEFINGILSKKSSAQSHILESDSFLKQGAKQLSGMGALFPEQKKKAEQDNILNLYRMAKTVLAVTGAFEIMRVGIRQLKDVVENARQVYVRATLSGFGVLGSQKIKNISEILGVSESDVFKFGAAMAYLNPKLEFANQAFAKTNRPLATLSVEFGVMTKNIEAAASVIATSFVPSLIKMTNYISELAIKLGKFDIKNQAESDAFGAFLKKYNIQGTRDVKTGETRFFTNDERGQSEGATGKLVNPALQKKLAELFEKFKSTYQPSSSGLPSPQAFMKQLPASALERMGLVIGGFGGGANDYARRTASATEKTAQILTSFVRGGSTIPRASFGFSPETSNP